MALVVAGLVETAALVAAEVYERLRQGREHKFITCGEEFADSLYADDLDWSKRVMWTTLFGF